MNNSKHRTLQTPILFKSETNTRINNEYTRSSSKAKQIQSRRGSFIKQIISFVDETSYSRRETEVGAEKTEEDLSGLGTVSNWS